MIWPMVTIWESVPNSSTEASFLALVFPFKSQNFELRIGCTLFLLFTGGLFSSTIFNVYKTILPFI